VKTASRATAVRIMWPRRALDLPQVAGAELGSTSLGLDEGDGTDKR
jgi:hypothetical protein